MLSTRWIGLLPAVALLLWACAAPASPTAEPTESASPTAAPTAAPTAPPSPQAGVKLTLWSLQSDPEPLTSLWARFETETGNELDIVKLPDDGFETALQTRWAGGERPDIFEWHTGLWATAAVNAAENLQDLSGEAYVSKSGDLYENNASFDGKVYGFIMSPPAPFGIFYRTDIFERLGLTPPSTAEELLSVCQEIKARDASLTPLFEGGGSGWPPYVAYAAHMGGPLLEGWLDKILNRTGRIDDLDSPLLASLRFYKQLQTECFNGDWLSTTYEDSYKALAEGTAAMVSQHSGILLDVRGAYGDDLVREKIGFAAWSETGPVVSIQGNPSGTFYLAKTGDAAREAAALEFIRFMSGPAYVDFVNGTKQFPTIEGVPVPSDVNPALLQAAEAVETYGSVNVIWDFLPGLSFDPVNEVVAGTTSPEDAVVKLQLSADQGARAAGLPGWP